MAKFVGVNKKGHIQIVSDKLTQNKNLTIVEVPQELEHLSSTDLIMSCRLSPDGILKSKMINKDIKDLRVAFVGNWAMSCGLATYFYNLVPEIAKYIKEFKLFIEDSDNWTQDIHQFGDNVLAKEQIEICWKRGEDLKELTDKILDYNPDIVIINHEYGLFPIARYWLAMMTQLQSKSKCYIIEHSVYPFHKDKTIVESICDNIIVHSQEAADILKKDKQINGKIHIIPHGCYPLMQKRLWNYYRSEHTILQMGFGFRYKAFEKSIEAIYKLKDKYKDIFLTILFSESEFSKIEHQLYYNELISLIEELKINQHIGIIRGFQSEYVSESFLLTNKILSLPYTSNPQHIVYGSSGMVRKGFSAQLAVITSKLPHFADTPSLKFNDVSEMIEQIDLLFSDNMFYKSQIEIQNSFVNENNWAITAKKYIDALTG